MRRRLARRPNPLLAKPPVSFHKLGWHSQRQLNQGALFSQKYLQDIYLGVHTTPHKDIAAWYALSAARRLRDVPILITIDIQGLVFEPDADALLKLNMLGPSLVREWADMFEEAEGDIEEALSIFENNQDSEYDEAPETISAEVFRALEVGFNPFEGAIRYAEVAGLTTEAVLTHFFSTFSTTRSVDDPLVRGVLAYGFPQHRVLEDIGPDRIVAIHRVGLVVDKPTAAARISLEELDYLSETADKWGIAMEEVPEHWQPDLTLIYENPELQGLSWRSGVGGRPIQEVEYHGTALTQAAQAFPELLTQALPELEAHVEDLAPWEIVEELEAALD